LNEALCKCLPPRFCAEVTRSCTTVHTSMARNQARVSRLYEAVCEGAPSRFCAKVTRVCAERDLRAAQRELAMLDAARGLPGVVQLWRGGAGCPRRPRVHEFVHPATGQLHCAIVMRCAADQTYKEVPGWHPCLVPVSGGRARACHRAKTSCSVPSSCGASPPPWACPCSQFALDCALCAGLSSMSLASCSAPSQGHSLQAKSA